MDVSQLIINHLPQKRKMNPRGWITFNAICCHHRGHKPDGRGRGNLRIGEDGVGYNCYNCGFKTKFDHVHLSDQFEQFLTWLGVERREIQRIKLDLLAREVQEGATPLVHVIQDVTSNFPPKPLPEGSQRVVDLLERGEDNPYFLQVVNYLASRGDDIAADYDYYWCNSTEHQLRERLIIPFTHRQHTVAWTARFAGTPAKGVPRYFNSGVPQGYLFNWNHLQGDRKFVILCEGPFDAIAVQGVASLGSTLSEQQVYNLLNSNKQIVVLPDRQRNNQQLIDVALSFGWAVSFPDWEEQIKDAADACKAYGQIYTITSALRARTTNALTINVQRKMLPG
jgi:hypothetical protein